MIAGWHERTVDDPGPTSIEIHGRRDAPRQTGRDVDDDAMRHRPRDRVHRSELADGEMGTQARAGDLDASVEWQ